MKAKKPLERDVQRAILDYLAMQPDFYCWRAQNAAIFDPTRKSFRRKGKYEPSGLPDILGIHSSGKMIAIEVKRPGSTYSSLSADQKAFLQKIAAMGGASTWVRSVEEVISFLDRVRNEARLVNLERRV